MLFANIDYLDADLNIRHGFVGTQGSRIVYVGESDPALMPAAPAVLPASPEPSSAGVADFGERYDGRGKLLVPGLYNAHTHAPMTLLRGYAEGLPLQAWLNDKIFPFEARISDERAYPATLLAIAEMLRFGTVSMTDMYYFDEARIRAIEESGIKANLSSGLICFDDLDYDKMPNKAVNDRLADDYHGSFDGRLRIDFNIHAEYTTTPQVVAAVGQHAKERGVQTHIHLSETRSEHEECKQRRGGLTPTAYFDSLGFFDAPCTAAHCVFTEPGDWRIMAERGVSAACNPASNMKLASGFAPVAQMLAAGVNVALGTDGVASNNNHNLFKEIYLLATIYKGASGDALAISPRQAIRAATVNGARSQGRGDCGQIALGERADLVVCDMDTPWAQPVHDLLNNLVYSVQGSDVVLTMVDGKVLYRDGQWPTIDVERAKAEASAAAEAIIKELQ
jgi:5-methylthioadenosine/S-adenosylhomocysteine deaminase